ncbi:pyridoxal phosphate-dependent aminotransferase [Salirhabdus salicampi]|uniref:pyridoxal phosphate-dependent aminotransferase n=1 Tax=Salirhabdus salicampi TaxID=476102 RepID=UPI0020C517AB|nr:pyridoxal phosphate-dependent aminotransferase [Salirhabdus salicampi]MCP8615818.1 pyridoxal phosphate-dependent aminotransferase [Salirhabdus salicampi]
MKQIQFSDALQRLPKQFFASLTRKVQNLQAEGHDVINLGQGNPDQPTPDHIVQSLQEAAANPAYHGYSPFRGHQFLKDAAATFYKREYDVDVNPDIEVAVLFGGKAGLVEISQCLLNKGDVALVPDPGYPDYWSGIAMANAKMETMPLLEKNDYLPNYQDISQGIFEKAKLMFLNYPNNPTAGIATEELFEETVNLANKYDICVVHDFAYATIGFDGKKPISFLQTPGAKEVGIEIYTLSKSYNMAGWRVGFAVGHPDVIRAIELIQDHFYVSLFGGIQKAAADALLGPQQCTEDMTKLYESRRNVLINGLKEIGWEVEAPKGSFFSWLKVPDGYTSEEFADLLLHKAHVVVAPGIGFGRNGEGYVRVGLLADESRLKEAVERIRNLKIFKR